MENTAIELGQETEALSIYEQAYAVKVIDIDTYNSAGELSLCIKDMTTQVTAYWKPLKDKAYAAHKEVCAKENELLKPLKDAQALIGNEQRRYLAEQERIRQEQERKARAIADEQARKERAKLEAQALAALDKGKEAKAEALIEQAAEVIAAPVFIAPVIDKNIRKDISVNCTDLKALCAEIGAGNIPTSVIKIKPAKLKSWAKDYQIKNGRFKGLVITDVFTPINRA